MSRDLGVTLSYIRIIYIQEGSCIVTGISYEGVDESGGVNWYGLANVHLLNHETGLTLQVCTNINV